jgi:hypothetical protein
MRVSLIQTDRRNDLKLHTDNTKDCSEDSIKSAIYKAREWSDTSLLFCGDQGCAAGCVVNEWRRRAVVVTTAVELLRELVPSSGHGRRIRAYSLL